MIDVFKKIIKTIGFITIIILLFLPFIGFLYLLRSNNKTVQFRPEFKIKEIENHEEEKIDTELLKSGLDKVKDSVFKLN